MTYNDIFVNLQYLDDMRQLALPAKATAEALIMRAAWLPAMRDIAEKHRAITAEDASDEAKAAALEAAASEEVPGQSERRFSPEAFGQIVDAAVGFDGTFATALLGGDSIHPRMWLADMSLRLAPIQ